MDRRKGLTIAVIVSAAAGLFAIRNATSTVSEIDESTRPTTTAIAIPSTITPTNEGCAYMWAYRDAPELTERLSSAVQAVDSQATIHASLFGEDCVYGDGHATFSAMETDFYISMVAGDLTDEEILGNKIKSVMDLIDRIPGEEIPGNDGFVEFQFVTGNSENLIVRVPISRYRNEGQGKGGAELLRMFLGPQVSPAPT